MKQALKYAPKEFIPISTNIHRIECGKAFSQLTQKEKLYSYYMSKAAWEGSKICWFQRSYESPALFVLLKLIFSGQNLEDLQNKLNQKGLTENQWMQILAYSATVFQNCGNYKSFGDTKFVPEFEPEIFKTLISSSKSYENDQYTEVMKQIYEKIEKEIYTEDEPFARIGFRDENNGTTSYYSSNISKDDAKMIDEWCQEINISPLNTRLIKKSDVEYDLLIASQDVDQNRQFQKNGITLNVKKQDFFHIMSNLVVYMENALKFTSDENQKNMIQAYIDHFRFGEVDKHKDSQRFWIKDVGPVVETNIGFIETYLDPLGARAEFEGFVAIVDKDTSKKFNNLVEQAEGLIEKLPWSKDFEKEKFSKPDFTNLDILSFACSGTPIGINIPNYDDIRQDFGFKNVNLGNVYPKPNINNIQFLSQEDMNYQIKYAQESLTLIVALHELLGHGTGKLFTKNAETGELNYPADFKNPFTNELINTAYLSTETWSQKFGKLHSGYEECRADSVALYLMNFQEPFEIFFSDRKSEWDDIFYNGWLDMMYSAVKSLKFYNPEQNVWGQAHCLASWAIFSAIREGDSSIITFDFMQKDEKDYFMMKIDRSKLKTSAFEALSKFLKKLHILKSIGDYDSAKVFFDHYSQVDEEMLKIRKIVIDLQLPRRLELQPNVFLQGEEVIYKDYDASFQGVVQSYVERFEENLLKDVYDEFLSKEKLFRYQ